MIVLLSLLSLSLLTLQHRGAVQAWLYATGQRVTRLEGRPAPELPPLRTLSGPPVRLSDLRGQVTLLHFWTFG